MPNSILVKFSVNRDEFEQQLEVQVQNLKQCNSIVITNVPSAKEALKLISKDWFKSSIKSYQNVFGISLKINEKIDEKFDANFHFIDISHKGSTFISFQSTIGKCENKIYWKDMGHGNFFSLDIDEDRKGEISLFCQEFLMDELKNGRTGIIKKSSLKNKIRLQEIGDSTGKNLLVLATSKKQLNVVKKLLENDFDADCAIDTAWKLSVDETNDEKTKVEASNITICLLNGNSRFPNNFEYDKASKDVKDFVEKCESLHKDVDEDNFDALKLKLESEPSLIYFYNRYNESLLAHSLKMRKLKIVEFLDKDITTGYHENLGEVYENMIKTDFRKLREQHKINAKEFPEAHIFILKSKSKIGNNDRRSLKKLKFVDEAFENLNSNNYCRKILKVAAEFKKLKIYFDFNHDSTYYLDPATSTNSKGIIYESGSIFIGAKYLTDDEKKFAVFGVLAHELCHLAVYLAFMNRNFDPFQLGDSKEKEHFKNHVMVQCEKRKKLDKIVKNVFNYPKNQHDSEMIVTVPQMLMEYQRNHKKIKRKKKQFKQLFKYSKDIVEKELENLLPVLKIIENEKEPIKYENLTEPMKAKLLHSKIKFQGEETSLNELVSNDVKVLKFLSSDEIRKVLISNKELEISQKFKFEHNNKIIERRFMPFYELDDWEKYLTVSYIIDETQFSKTMILVDHAGTGKTTMFEHVIEELKILNTNSWIYLINLRKQEGIFKEFKEETEHLDMDGVVIILLKIIKPTSEIEREVFVKLISNGKSILLFDGIDEISPKYTELLIKMCKILLERKDKNQIWISTRPHYARKLQEELDIYDTFKFARYTANEKEAYIKAILMFNKYKGDHDQMLQQIQSYISQPKLKSYYDEGIDNSLMISIITELHAQNAINTKTNDYEIYYAMFKQQCRKVDEKVEFDERDPFKKFTILSIHQVLALKLVIGNYEKKLDELTIMQIWNREKKNITADMIQRYGFVTVDLDDLDENSIDFIHRSYAEFFIAIFIIDSIFEDNIVDRDEEIERKFQILNTSLRYSHSIVCNFIFSFLEENRKTSDFALHAKIRYLISQEIFKIHDELDEIPVDESYVDYPEEYYEIYGSNRKRYIDFNYIKEYSSLLLHDKELLNLLWRTKQENDLLKKIIRDSYENNFKTAMEYVEFSFGHNWHMELNKSESKLIADEEIEIFKDNNTLLWNQTKNLIKFCELVDKNYTSEEKLEFYDKVQLENIGNIKIRREIITRMRKNAHGTKFISECLEELCVCTISTESLEFVLSQCEQAIHIDRNLIRNHLRGYVPKILHNTYDSDLSGTFEILKNFFLNYFTRKELEDIILSLPTFFNIFEGAEHMYYSEYKQFIHDIYSPSNFSKIIEKINDYFPLLFNHINPERTSINTKDLLMLIFSNDENRADNFMKKILKVGNQIDPITNAYFNPY